MVIFDPGQKFVQVVAVPDHGDGSVRFGVLASNSKWRRLIIPKAHCLDCGGKLKLIALVKTK
jgi:hypothetical protein